MSEISAIQHVAIIMDGNGRWAQKRKLPRVAGHKKGVDAVKQVIQSCVAKKISCLTLFAFSTENWSRPDTEVSELMSLFILALKREIKQLHAQGVRICVIGERARFSQDLQKEIAQAEAVTEDNKVLRVNIAASYGGRWDVVQAVRRIVEQGTASDEIDEALLSDYLSTADCPDLDLLIRTGGEQRVSNFLLWQLAYSELAFTDTLWPNFGRVEFERLVDLFGQRERRFGSVK